MSRADEISQGLRHEDGGLIGGLDIMECVKAAHDYRAGRPPPKITSASYDVWRARLAQEDDERRQVMAAIEAEQRRQHESVRRALLEAGRPDLVAELDAKISALSGDPQ